MSGETDLSRHALLTKEGDTVASPQTLFGTGIVLSHNHLVALVEYTLVVTLVGQTQELMGSLLVLEGDRDLGGHDQLLLQLEDGSSSDVSAAIGDAETGKFGITATLRPAGGAA
jgi:hypothetical protein